MKTTASKKILVGICGGIAAYKTVEVVSQLRHLGHDVHVAMSEAATEFVTPLTFAAVSGNRVLTKMFPDAEKQSGDDLYPHLYPATQADLFILMPATADMIGRITQGRGSDMVSLCALSLPAHCQRFFCPAMNMDMWMQATVQESSAKLETNGWIRLGPETGSLACGVEGVGRMMEPADILHHLSDALNSAASLQGLYLLITSGPTHEYLDPVRYIGNASSGQQGKALAEQAADRGARVTFITGPVHASLLPHRNGIEVIPVTSAADMLTAAKNAFPECQAAIFAAAVADYCPVTYKEHKEEKNTANWTLELMPTPDIAATLSSNKKADQHTIGFALQSGNGVPEATDKLAKKNFDGIILNHPEAMGAEAGIYTYLTSNGSSAAWGSISKRECAKRILSEVAAWWQQSRHS